MQPKAVAAGLVAGDHGCIVGKPKAKLGPNDLVEQAIQAVQEAADALGISRATADRYWAYAKVWLYSAIHGQARDSDP
jgi:hypothetical protein